MRSISLLLSVSMALLGAAPGCAQATGASAPASTLIINATIIDGTGAPARQGAVRVTGDRISDIGSLRPRSGETVIDAHNHVVAPGFIDCHNHLDLLQTPDANAAISQGVTTIVVGPDGFSESPLSRYFPRIEAAHPAVNVASFSGHNTLRALTLPPGDTHRPANAAEIAKMRIALAADMREGALGLSSGLAYETGLYSNTDEVAALNETSAHDGGLYSSHMRNEDVDVENSVRELIDIGRRSHGRVHVSHIKISTMGLWGHAPQILALLDAARAQGLDVSADMYPYAAWNTTMEILFPDRRYVDAAEPQGMFDHVVPADKIVLQTFHPDRSLENRTIADIARARGKPPGEVYLALIQQLHTYQAAHPEDKEAEGIIGFGMDERDIASFMAWPNTSICSDGSNGDHPRGYGAFARTLGVYVRERHVITLVDAVRKMTSLNASQLHIEGRGVLRRGAYADITIFDSATVIDRSTFQQPMLTAAGFDLVMVNGAIVYRDGVRTDARSGRIVRRQQN